MAKKPKPARAAKPAKAPKGAKPAKPAKPAKAPKAPKQAAATNRLLDPKMKALFNQCLDQWQRLEAKVKGATDLRKKFERENIKAHGFTIKQIKLANQISTPEGEAVVAARMTEEVLVHAYMGKAIGEQLEIMLEPPPHDPLKTARDQGYEDAKHNRKAHPVFAPETDGYKAYMDAYHEEQARQVRGGISKLEKAKEKTKAAEAKAAAAKANRRSVRGTPLTPAGVKAAADRAETASATKNGRDAGPPSPGLGMTRADHFADEPPAGNA